MSSRLFGHCRIHVFGIAERKAIICCYRALRTNELFLGPSQNPSCFHVGIFLFVFILALFCRKNVFFFLSSFVAGLKSVIMRANDNISANEGLIPEIRYNYKIITQKGNSVENCSPY